MDSLPYPRQTKQSQTRASHTWLVVFTAYESQSFTFVLTEWYSATSCNLSLWIKRRARFDCTWRVCVWSVRRWCFRWSRVRESFPHKSCGRSVPLSHEARLSHSSTLYGRLLHSRRETCIQRGRSALEVSLYTGLQSLDSAKVGSNRVSFPKRKAEACFRRPRAAALFSEWDIKLGGGFSRWWTLAHARAANQTMTKAMLVICYNNSHRSITQNTCIIYVSIISYISYVAMILRTYTFDQHARTRVCVHIRIVHVVIIKLKREAAYNHMYV
jgi:hypothetical protein